MKHGGADGLGRRAPAFLRRDLWQEKLCWAVRRSEKSLEMKGGGNYT